MADPALAIDAEATGMEEDETSGTPSDSNDSISGVSDNIDGPQREGTYEELLVAQAREERAFIDDAIERETDDVVAEGNSDEVLVEAAYSKNRLREMRDPYVVGHDGQKYHKKSLLKKINKGKKLVKSFDRLERVKGTARRGGTDDGVIDSVVTRAFDFKYPHNTGSGPDSGGDRHNSDDYCCVMIDSDKVTQMVLGKFQRFGGETSSTPLELYWPRNKGDFRASVVIIDMVEYTNVSNDQCLRSVGNILGTLRNIHSSCLVPVTPDLEDSAPDGSQVVVTNAIMKVSELMAVFADLRSKKKHLRAKNDMKVHPITIGDNKPFIVLAPAVSLDLPVCNICVPPKVIGKPNMKAYDIQRALRNHNALHQILAQESFKDKDEPYGLCCGPTCGLDVDITAANKRNILAGTSKILPDSIVFHNCKTFDSLEPFQYKYVKPKTGYPCNNIPVLCHDCPTQNFIWSYNIEAHYIACHAELDEEDRKKYPGLFITDEETRLIKEAANKEGYDYAINVAHD